MQICKYCNQKCDKSTRIDNGDIVEFICAKCMDEIADWMAIKRDL